MPLMMQGKASQVCTYCVCVHAAFLLLSISFIMNTAIALRSAYRSTLRHQTPRLFFFNAHQPVRHVSTATTSAPPSAEPTPTPLDHPTQSKRRTPLSEEQQRFLDSAVHPPFISSTPFPLPGGTSSRSHLSLSNQNENINTK